MSAHSVSTKHMNELAKHIERLVTLCGENDVNILVAVHRADKSIGNVGCYAHIQRDTPVPQIFQDIVSLFEKEEEVPG